MLYICDIWMFLHAFRPILHLLNIDDSIIAYVVIALQFCQYMYAIIKNNQTYLYKSFILFVLFLFVYQYSSITSNMIYIFLGCMILRSFSLDKIINHFFYVQLFLVFIHVFLLTSGFINNKILISFSKGITNTLGFHNPNVASSFYYNFVLLLMLYLRNIKTILFQCIIIIIFSFAIYKITGGRTYYISELVYVGWLVLSVKTSFVRKTRCIYSYIPIILCALFYMMMISDRFDEFDEMFSRRFIIAKYYFDELQPINYILGMQLLEGALDSAYILLICGGGSVSLFFFFSTYIKGIINAPDCFLSNFFPFIISMLVCGFSEAAFAASSIISILFFRILAEYSFIQTTNKVFIHKYDFRNNSSLQR